MESRITGIKAYIESIMCSMSLQSVFHGLKSSSKSLFCPQSHLTSYVALSLETRRIHHPLFLEERVKHTWSRELQATKLQASTWIGFKELMIYGGFLSHRGTPKSSRKKQSIKGVPPFKWKPPNIGKKWEFTAWPWAFPEEWVSVSHQTQLKPPANFSSLCP